MLSITTKTTWFYPSYIYICRKTNIHLIIEFDNEKSADRLLASDRKHSWVRDRNSWLSQIRRNESYLSTCSKRSSGRQWRGDLGTSKWWLWCKWFVINNARDFRMSTQPQITRRHERQDAKKKRCLLYSGQVVERSQDALTPPYYHQRKSKMTGAREKSFVWKLKQTDALHAKFVTGKFSWKLNPARNFCSKSCTLKTIFSSINRIFKIMLRAV